jgi:hypothetical protein
MHYKWDLDGIPLDTDAQTELVEQIHGAPNQRARGSQETLLRGLDLKFKGGGGLPTMWGSEGCVTVAQEP